MGQKVQVVQTGQPSNPQIRYVGKKGVIGCEGRPPGFQVVRHAPAKQEPSNGSGRVTTCGSIVRD